ncbi:hypothetical protein SCP_1702540 [Sparassis crispa]|uniref:Aminoglycoside phosphotransferase domain-containing protein n=1 Tax=Sparassis crispa TaxID=139825 RepID=A0A401H659_9APHY|nr:hypothetical protein SCP_1702540 [Sparassis crispa]GBE89928.1 hypothetical protein SCP_1702540 [Sparassis crispa]
MARSRQPPFVWTPAKALVLDRMKNPWWRFYYTWKQYILDIPRRVVIALWRVTLARWFFVKISGDADVEIATLRFVATHTSIPVPRVWWRFDYQGFDWIVLSRITGSSLSEVWPNLSFDEKEAIATQLARYMAELRNLPPPPGTMISSVLGGPVNCSRLHEDPSGPFRDEQQMNLQLRNLQPLESCSATVVSAHSRIHPLVFTHNDFYPRNIMVQHNKVTAIIDWECAGWFPAHWEYCKTMNWGTWVHPHALWCPWVHKFIPPFLNEEQADRELLEQFFVPSAHAP